MSEMRLGHRYADALAYVQDHFTPAEKAAFEAHVSTCAECQASVALARKLLPALQEALELTLLKEEALSTEALLANVRAAHARGQSAPKESWVARYWGRLVLAGVAVAAVLLVMRTPPVPSGGPQPLHMYAPVPDNVPRAHRAVDGGDGG